MMLHHLRFIVLHKKMDLQKVRLMQIMYVPYSSAVAQNISLYDAKVGYHL